MNRPAVHDLLERVRTVRPDERLQSALLAVLDICAVVSPVDKDDVFGSLYEYGLNDIRDDIRAAVAGALTEEGR